MKIEISRQKQWVA